MTLRATLLPLALRALSCVGSRSPTVAVHDWHVVELDGVRHVAELHSVELRARAAELAGFQAAFAHLVGAPTGAQRPTTIHLVRHPAIAGQLGLGRVRGGWAMKALDGSYGCVLSRGHPVETRQILFHEYTHLRLHHYRHLPLPRWYNEGLAEYFSTLGIRDGALVIGAARIDHLQWLSRRPPLPVGRLVSSPARVVSGDLYATSWLLVHHLLATPKGRQELARFEKELALGAAIDDAREAAFGRPFEALDDELATHLGHLLQGFAAENALDPREIAVATPPEPAPIAPAEVAHGLAALALSPIEDADDDAEDADLGTLRRLLETAVDERGSPGSRAALAQLRALDGDGDGAATAIATALRDAPGDAEVRLRAGRIALASERPGEARGHFEAVLAADAGSAAAWFGLGRALLREGDGDAALAALERARDVAWSPALDLELGRLHLEAERSDEAVALQLPLARDPHRGPAGEKAAELLRDAGLLPEDGGEKP